MYGEGPGECFEGNTTLAALSGITERARLGLLVTGMTYRHPSVFAAEAITIDHASGGRLELSYGAAWFDKEHTELGIPFPALKDRVDAFEEAVQIVRGLLTTDNFTFEGRHYSVTNATLRPRPVQQPHPPIWIGASGERRMMPIAARYADVWHCFGPVEHLSGKSQRLSELAEAAGRDPATIRRAASLSLEDDPDTIARHIDAWSRRLRLPRVRLACGRARAGRGVRAAAPPVGRMFAEKEPAGCATRMTTSPSTSRIAAPRTRRHRLYGCRCWGVGCCPPRPGCRTRSAESWCSTSVRAATSDPSITYTR